MKKLWLEQYEQGVPYEINLNVYRSLVDLFEVSCRDHKTNVAFSNMGFDLSYNEVEQLSRQFAIYLQQMGLQRGSRVAVMLPNILQYPIVFFGILRAGLIAVNTNPLYTSDEVVHQINDSGAEILVVFANSAKTVEQSLDKMPSLKHIIVTQIGDMFPLIKRTMTNWVVKYIKKLVPDYTIPHAISLLDALKQGLKGTLIDPELTNNDIALLQYTGGTTGVSKGAMLTHGNLVANILQASSWVASLLAGTEDIIVTALPLYHIFSLTANCLVFFKSGAKNLLITNPRDLPRFIKDIKRAKFTVITGVNTLFNALLNHPKFSQIDFSKLKMTLSGGMALQQVVAQRWKRITLSPILEAYGLTETSPAVTINPMHIKEYNGSIGLPLPSTEISIRDDDGVEVPLGERGELCIKGPQVMPGYWQHTLETELVFFSDGFLRTGDIAIADEQGFIYLVDRKKDLILISGFNVYPNEIEKVISQLEGVLEVGVIGVKLDDAGESIKACIVKRDPDLTEEQVIKHCREHLTAYKVPHIIEFYKDLPKSNLGKVLRRQLKLANTG